MFRLWRNFKIKRRLNHDLMLLDQNSLIFDIGANVGEVTRIFSKTNARVIAFEPHPNAFIKLQKKFKKVENVVVLNLAAGKVDRFVKLYLHEDTDKSKDDLSQASSLLLDKPNVSRQCYINVKEIDLSQYINSLGLEIDLMKIDIEGYEIELINHLIDSGCINKIKKIIVETHEKKFPDLKGPTDKLRERVVQLGLQRKFDFDWH
jgi:FkbM family methyltransferase